MGKLYYDATGKEILFYPVFADRQRREIKIGTLMAYNASLPSREAKQAVADALHLRMEELSQQPKNKKDKKCLGHGCFSIFARSTTSKKKT